MIKEIIKTTDRYNLHSHTPWCDGRSSMDEMAQAAIDADLEVFGFSSHGPMPWPTPCNMDEYDMAEYIAECEQVKDDFDGCIRLLMGVEADYLYSRWGPRQLSSYGFDYMIGSVHFLENQKGEWFDVDGSPERFAVTLHDHFQSDLRYVVEKYFDRVAQMTAEGGFDILGHFDKIARNATHIHPDVEREDWYEPLVMSVIDEAEKAGVVVEMNTKLYEREGRFFPNHELWLPEVVRRGLPIAVNSDAHSADLVNSGRQQALNILKLLSPES